MFTIQVWLWKCDQLLTTGARKGVAFILFTIQVWSWKHDQPLTTGPSIGVTLTVVFNTGMVMEV